MSFDAYVNRCSKNLCRISNHKLSKYKFLYRPQASSCLTFCAADIINGIISQQAHAKWIFIFSHNVFDEQWQQNNVKIIAKITEEFGWLFRLVWIHLLPVAQPTIIHSSSVPSWSQLKRILIHFSSSILEEKHTCILWLHGLNYFTSWRLNL